MNSFYTDVIQKSPLFHNTNRIETLDLLEPTFRAKIEALIVESTKKGFPFMVLETYRSAERQVMLYNQKATQLRNVGVHHYGLAVDLVKNINGEPSFKGDFTLLGELAKDNDLIWGGDWGTPKAKHTFRDYDHVQRISVADQNKLFAGTWYPDASYDPYART